MQGESLHHGCIENFLGNLSLTIFWTPVYICERYDQKNQTYHFLAQTPFVRLVVDLSCN